MVSDHSLARILVVDDDEDIVSNLFDILTDIGYRTEVATDGNTALEMMSSRTGNGCPFDLALIDYRLPGMDGASLIQRIHALYPSFRAIMITGHTADDGVQAIRKHERLTILQKPVDMRSLLELIDHALN